MCEKLSFFCYRTLSDSSIQFYLPCLFNFLGKQRRSWASEDCHCQSWLYRKGWISIYWI